jgi:bifunctional non-homologous end joining protein LigD
VGGPVRRVVATSYRHHTGLCHCPTGLQRSAERRRDGCGQWCTYEADKFRDPGVNGEKRLGAKGPDNGEVIVTLHGRKISGRYALIQTNGKNWLAHRMKEQTYPQADDFAPVLATVGSVQTLKATQWAFEAKWDGYRVLVDANHGRLNLRSRRGRDVTAEYPQFAALAANLATTT